MPDRRFSPQVLAIQHLKHGNNPETVKAIETEDGNIMCYVEIVIKDTELHYSMYFIVQGKKIDVKFPERFSRETATKNDFAMTTQGNTIYFSDHRKIYKVKLNPHSSNDVPSTRVSLVRNMDEEESMKGGICFNKRDGTVFLYRMYDDPEEDAIPECDDFKSLHKSHYKPTKTLCGIHRKRAVYIEQCSSCKSDEYGNVQKITEKTLHVGIPYRHHLAFFSSDTSSFIYFIGCDNLEKFETCIRIHSYYLLAYETESTTFLPHLIFTIVGNSPISSIVGVCDGVISMIASNKDRYRLNHGYSYTNTYPTSFSAQLPYGYYESRPLKTATARLEKTESELKFLLFEEKIPMRMEIMENKLDTAVSEWAKERDDLINKHVDAERKVAIATTENEEIMQRLNVMKTQKNETVAELEKEKSHNTETLLKYKEMEESMQKQINNIGNKLETALSEWSKEKSELTQKCVDAEKKLAKVETEKAIEQDQMKQREKDMQQRLEKIEIQTNALKADLVMERNRNTRFESSRADTQVEQVPLKFREIGELSKLYDCIQLENGQILYFDNVKPFELFTNIDYVYRLSDGNLVADLSVLEGECNCSFKGTDGNCAFFSATRGKNVTFFKASIENEEITFEKLNELKTTDLILFESQPLYFIEEGSECIVYKYHENYEETEGEKIFVPTIRSISKYTRHYHRGILYFFRENSIDKIERLGEKVVIVEGPKLDGFVSFYAPSHSEIFYILNSDLNIILVFDTTTRIMTELCYQAPVNNAHNSFNLSIVGVREKILTAVYQGNGVLRWMMATQLP